METIAERYLRRLSRKPTKEEIVSIVWDAKKEGPCSLSDAGRLILFSDDSFIQILPNHLPAVGGLW